MQTTNKKAKELHKISCITSNILQKYHIYLIYRHWRKLTCGPNISFAITSSTC